MKKDEYFPSCKNNKCDWNMGNRHSEAYDYLDDTCYHNSASNDFKNCDKKQPPTIKA